MWSYEGKYLFSFSCLLGPLGFGKCEIEPLEISQIVLAWIFWTIVRKNKLAFGVQFFTESLLWYPLQCHNWGHSSIGGVWMVALNARNWVWFYTVWCRPYNSLILLFTIFNLPMELGDDVVQGEHSTVLCIIRAVRSAIQECAPCTTPTSFPFPCLLDPDEDTTPSWGFNKLWGFFLFWNGKNILLMGKVGKIIPTKSWNKQPVGNIVQTHLVRQNPIHPWI